MKGQEAGTIRPDGYKIIRINGSRYRANRLAWFLVTGEWPKHEIDHKNGIQADDSWLNLREATTSQNKQNRRKSLHKSSAYKGVQWSKSRKTWQARITVNGKVIYLGQSKNELEAYAFYCKAATKLHGDFAKLN